MLALKLPAVNVDDCAPVPELTPGLFGKLFGDKGCISQIEHTRHRSGANFLVNLVAGLVAYAYQPKKPSLNLRRHELSQLPVLV